MDSGKWCSMRQNPGPGESLLLTHTYRHIVEDEFSPSFRYSATTTGSKVNLPAAHALITRKDLRQSILCFEEVNDLQVWKSSD